jgi:TPR repeat protein
MVWGTDKDIDNSVYWYERAAKKRHIGAKNRLSKIFNID